MDWFSLVIKTLPSVHLRPTLKLHILPYCTDFSYGWKIVQSLHASQSSGNDLLCWGNQVSSLFMCSYSTVHPLSGPLMKAHLRSVIESPLAESICLRWTCIHILRDKAWNEDIGREFGVESTKDKRTEYYCCWFGNVQYHLLEVRVRRVEG